ncbi:unnamed protein product, partial [Prorocentrum cordatum]
AKELGLPGAGKRWLASATLPMGWKSAMGLIQYLHRRLLTNVSGPPWALPAERELRKDRAAPRLSSSLEGLRAIWLIYADDFDVPEIFENREQLLKAQSEGPPAFYQWAGQQYQALEVPTSTEKAGRRQQVTKRLGARIDGAVGAIGPDAQQIGQMLRLTLHVISRGHSNARQLQVFGGHWTHAMQFRREASGALAVHSELWLAIFLLSVMVIWLGSPLDPVPTASDASETGGGVCATRGLSPRGHAAALRDLALLDASAADAVGLIGVCDGVGGARQAFHLLGLAPAMHRSIESDPAARQAMKARWPDGQNLGDLGLSKFVEAMDWFREIFDDCVVLRLAENAQSLSPGSREHCTQLLRCWPVGVCPGRASPVGRPRYYWCDWAAQRRAQTQLEAELEDVRCGLIGSAFHAPAVAWPLGSALFELRALQARPCFGRCWGELADQEAEKLAEQLGLSQDPRELEKQAVALLHRSATFKESDVRLADQVVLAPHIWPRRGLDPFRWRWKVLLAPPLSSQHINALELKAVLTTMRWRARFSSCLGCRWRMLSILRYA